MLGLGLGLASAALRGTVWRPGFLFKGGQSGLWGNIQEGRPMRLFQDAAGTIPANQAGQPVGKVVRAAGTVDATQATALSRPTLARWPKGGRRNRASKNGVRVVGSVNVADGFLDPNGGYDAVKVTFSGPNQALFLVETMTLTEPLTFSSRVFVRGVAGETIRRRAEGSNSEINVTLTGDWQQISEMNVTGTHAGFNLSTYSGATAREIYVYAPQSEIGPSLGPYQRVISNLDVTEAGVPDIWHLWNDGGDSLLAPLPTGTYEVATVGIDGKPHYANVTGDDSGKNILLGSARIADIFARTGTLSDAERLRLEEYWQQRYGAGYLIPPGMVPGARQMWETSSGGAAAVSAGQPIGTMLVDASVVKGPSLNPASAWSTNQPGTWEINTATGVATIAAQAAAGNYDLRPSSSQSIPDTAGKWLWVEFDYEVTGGTLSWYPFQSSPITIPAGSGRISQPVLATVTTHLFRVPAGVSAKLSNWSVREVIGQFASQATALSRPTLARHPKGGQRRNLLTWTEDFGNAVWTKVGATVTPVGGGAFNVIPSSGQEYIPQRGVSSPHVAGITACTLSVDIKHNGLRYGVVFGRVADWFGVSFQYDFSTGSFVSRLIGITGTITSEGAEEVGDGWVRVHFSYAFDGAGHVRFNVSGSVSPLTGVNNRELTGDGVNGVLVRFPQVETTPVLTPYQRVTTAFDVTEAGIPDVWHLWNDGGDSLPAILPAGAWEIAWVNHLGVIGYASVTSDGTTGTDLLRTERMADVAVKRGRFTSYERAQLQAQWEKYKP